MQPDQQLILDAARRGDWEAADRAELVAIRFNVWPTYPDGEPFDWPSPGSYDSTLVPVRIRRHAGPSGESLVDWYLVLPCGKCYRRGRRNSQCTKCGGDGFLERDIDVWNVDPWVVTTLDGTIREDWFELH